MLTVTKEYFDANVKKLDEAIKLAERVLNPSSKSKKRIVSADKSPLTEIHTQKHRVVSDNS